MTLEWTTRYPAVQELLRGLLLQSKANPDLYKRYFGTKHEVLLLEELKNADVPFLAGYHQICGQVGREHFEVDLALLFSNKQIFILEVKAYTGKITTAPVGGVKWHAERENQMVSVKNPILQAERTARLFRKWLSFHGIELVVIPLVVFTCNPSFREEEIESLFRQQEVPVLTSKLLPAYFKNYVAKLESEDAGGVFLSMLRKIHLVPMVIDSSLLVSVA